MSEFGPEAYFVNYPSKFLSNEIDNDGYYEMYLSFSANYINQHTQSVPAGSGYHWSLQQSRFKLSASFIKRLNFENTD